MNVRECIQTDITIYAQEHNLPVTDAIDALIKCSSNYLLEEMKNYPPIAVAWQILQVEKGTHLQYHRSNDLGEFVFDNRMYYIHDDFLNYSTLELDTRFRGDLVIPEGLLSTEDMFADRAIPSGVTFGEAFDTSNIRCMSGMFRCCTLPKDFSLGPNFDTSNVEFMDSMFDQCKFSDNFSLGDKFDTSKVTRMNSMFAKCSFPKNFTLGNKFDTSSVEDMRFMFAESTLREGFKLGDKFELNNTTVRHIFDDATLFFDTKGYNIEQIIKLLK